MFSCSCTSLAASSFDHCAHIMAARSGPAGVSDVQPSAGAAEPGALTMVPNDESVLRVAFYNVGMEQSDLDTKRIEVAQERCRKFAHDIVAAFRDHRLDLLCICELGEHTIGLEGKKNLRCESQEQLLLLVLRMVDEELRGGAQEPAIAVDLVSGQYPTYAAMKRRGSKLEVQKVSFHFGLDRRPGKHPDRTMMTLQCRWMGEPIRITNCHCPSSTKRVWDNSVKAAVLPNVFRLAGLVPFDDWRDGAAEPVAWILGGDLNLGPNYIANEMNKYQPPRGDERGVQIVDAGSLVMHPGDYALTQHMETFKKSSMIGRDYQGISDNHNMVVVFGKLRAVEKRGGAVEPTGPTAPPLGAGCWSARDTHSGGARRWRFRACRSHAYGSCKQCGARLSGPARRSAEAHASSQGAGRPLVHQR